MLNILEKQNRLADVAYFIQNFKQTTKGASDSQIITFGCSYPGALAAWFRGTYPFHTTGSISSSGPVQATLDFYEYLVVVDQSLGLFSIHFTLPNLPIPPFTHSPLFNPSLLYWSSL